MINNPPIREPAGDNWSGSWVAWFQNVFDCIRWKKAFNYTFTLDFANTLANSQSSGIAVTVKGVVVGDAVLVTPSVDTAGVLFKGVVTAANTVTVYACNFTAGAINPPSTTFRIVVLQN